MLQTWREDSLQFKITVFTADVTQIVQSLQKQLQKANLLLPDVLTARDSAVRKLELLNDGPIPPGGLGEKHLGSFYTEESDDC